MDPFVERMIARANLRRGEKQETQTSYMSKDFHLSKTCKTNEPLQNNNRFPMNSNESIPIRSPRKLLLNDATFRKNCESKDSNSRPEKTLEECHSILKSKVLLSKGSGESEMSLIATQIINIENGHNFIPGAISTPILGRSHGNKNQGISNTHNSEDKGESKSKNPNLMECNDTLLTTNNVKTTNFRNAFQEKNNYFPLIGTLKEEQTNWSVFPPEKPKAFNKLKNETSKNTENGNTFNILEDNQLKDGHAKGGTNFSINEKNSTTNTRISISTVVSKCKKSFTESNKVNLEDVDEMEDRVSELEIKVDDLRIDEINIPKVEKAQEMVKYDVQEIKCDDSDNSERILDATRLKVRLEDKKSCISMPLKESCISRNLGSNGHSLNDYLDNSSYSNQKYSIVANVSGTEATNFSEQNDETLTESSHNDHSQYSIHSEDFSFSCSCSTSISQSSIHHEIPNQSLPFLILQNLSYNRKSQRNSSDSTHAQIDNTTEQIDSAIHCENEESTKKECSLRELKVNQLHRKVSIESTTMEQASKALSLCYSSLAFSGSPQQIEGERLLLLSTLRKQAYLDEIRRLEAQNSLFLQQTESIELTVDKIRIHLMEDFLSNITSGKQQYCYYFICIISYKENVLCSDVIQAAPGQPSIEFKPKNFKMEVQFCDNILLGFRVYALQVAKCVPERGRAKLFARKTWEPNKERTSSAVSHPPCACSCTAGNSESKLNTDYKKKNEESSIRISSFIITARTELYLPENLNKNSLQLEQYEPFCCNGNHFKILQDIACINITCSFKSTRCDSTIDKYVSKDHQGFLTRFSIIGGSGAWQREWWCLKGTFLLSWKYPEDEEYLPPNRVINLKLSNEKISVVPRRKCARRNTFLVIENGRGNSLEEQCSTINTWDDNGISASVTEHILSADTREEMENWCKKLNGVLYLMQLWKVTPNLIKY